MLDHSRTFCGELVGAGLGDTAHAIQHPIPFFKQLWLLLFSCHGLQHTSSSDLHYLPEFAQLHVR